MNEPFHLGTGDSYQTGGYAWSPRRADVGALLRTAQHVATRPIHYGSNHTFLVTLDAGEEGKSLAVYKPARGEYPLYDFPSGTLYQREIGAWIVDQIMGTEVVPATVAADGRYGVGSLQLFIESRETAEVELESLRSLALLDVVLNNADRKAEHCLVDGDNHIWGIDHGLSFHVENKLRTVFWHFAGQPLTSDEVAAVTRLDDCLQAKPRHHTQYLKKLLGSGEWSALRFRVERFLEMGRFPNPRYKNVPYQW
ncbi:MAG: SCO1664 family protein [Chloroflexota bacterium]